MALVSRLSCTAEVTNGSDVRLVESFSESDPLLTQVFHTPTKTKVAALVSDKKIDLCDVLNVKIVFIKANQDFDVKLGSSTNTPIRVRKGEDGFALIALTADFVNDPNPLSTTGLFVSNPSGVVEVEMEFLISGT